jgi:predicted  nucleic acid-binding Zn-ribbon protein
MTDPRHDIVLLVSVARIEASLYAHKMTLQKLPTDIATIDKALADLEARDKALQATLEDLAKKRRDTEKSLREHEEHLKKSKGQQSLVKTNEEYTAMLKEISNLESQIGEEEEQLLLLMDRIETAQAEAARASDIVKTERAKRAGERAALEAQQANVKAEVERLSREKPKILSEVSPPLLKRYERLSERHRDVAVTRVLAEHCGACGQQLPPQLAVEVRKGDQFIMCPACGRILIHYAD